MFAASSSKVIKCHTDGKRLEETLKREEKAKKEVSNELWCRNTGSKASGGESMLALC